MDPTTQAWLFALLGAVLGGGVVASWRISERSMRGAPAVDEPLVPLGVGKVLNVLRSSALVVDTNDRVLQASAPAYAMGLVRGEAIIADELVELVRQVRRDGQIRETELELDRPGGVSRAYVSARIAPLSSRLVLVLVEDRTREHRVEAIRRDFVANVSHELKTPVGAITLLADAVEGAREDPEAVTRFAGLMVAESSRLNRLVQQIIELSRLQGDEPLTEQASVDVGSVIERAVESSAIEAGARDVELAHWVQPAGLHILGNHAQVTLALSNLIANAVAYSADQGRVVVTARAEGDTVCIAVADQGIGIPATELDRIFERFYRVDPSRHRATGGTGLGLSIVKHVAALHGGTVEVWSVEGRGSTFTLRLPASHAAGPETPDERRSMGVAG